MIAHGGVSCIGVEQSSAVDYVIMDRKLNSALGRAGSNAGPKDEKTKEIEKTHGNEAWGKRKSGCTSDVAKPHPWHH